MTSRSRLQSETRGILAFAGLLVAVLAGAIPTEAEACSYAPVLNPAAPRDGETDIALNAQILLRESVHDHSRADGGYFKLERILEDGGTSEVALTVEALKVPGRLYFYRHVLTPTEPLSEETTYRVSASFAFGSDFSFTTGAMSDTTAPPVPDAPVQEVIPYEPSPYGECPDAGFPDSCSGYGVGGTKLHFPAQPDVVAWDILKPDGGVIAPRIGSGQMAWYQCLEDWTSGVLTTEWRPPEDGEILIRAVDIAGNISEPRPITLRIDCQPKVVCSEPTNPDGGTVEGRAPDGQPDDAVKPLPDTGCSSAPSAVLAGLVFVAFLLGRRRFGIR